jgi:hypothetical protein
VCNSLRSVCFTLLLKEHFSTIRGGEGDMAVARW